MAFVIDTKGQQNLLTKKQITVGEENDSDDDFDFIPISKDSKPSTSRTRPPIFSKDGDVDLDDCTYLDFNRSGAKTTAREQARRFTDTSKLLEKSVLQPGVEKLHSLPSEEGRRQLAKKRKLEREKSAGKNWFNMKAPEMTEEMKNDLEVLKMRSALDPKHFYKKNDMKVLPKYFQIGRIVESAADFYHSRVPKKDRKKSFVDELLADAEFQRSTKKRYKDIIAEQRKTDYRAHRQAGKLKKRKN
ncbi:hypothetical protein ONE63_003678 [Megalurothrips usitatus]|uniref:Fcf2 pre-rRNA processing C-terminal domain-containing protein n=1 Tax=Megalurothrips usitatus TaxID=439358 RepID=A0AAV7XAA1_9NEOP|nr:hypothetical protein ONE63_003678 [Megalurothrips usitatus]